MKKISSSITVLLLALTAVLFVACDDDEGKAPQPQSIAEILKSDPLYSDFYTYLEFHNLIPLLEGPSNYTVFAVPNYRLSNSGITYSIGISESFRDEIKYHILEGSHKIDDFQEGQTYVNTLADYATYGVFNSILVEKSGDSLVLNGRQGGFINADIIATNGVVHKINYVLLNLDIVEHIEANSNLSSMANALLHTGDAFMYSILGGTSVQMAFAPSNSAFDAASAEMGTLTDEQQLNLLKYHAAYGFETSDELHDGMMLTTLQGENIQVNINGDNMSLTDAKGNVANVLTKDINCTNGPLYIIDKVLFPMNL